MDKFPHLFHFIYHFPVLQDFDLKKSSCHFKDLDKFLKPIPAISLSLKVKHGRVSRFWTFNNTIENNWEKTKSKKKTPSAAHGKRLYQSYHKALSSAHFYSRSKSMISSWYWRPRTLLVTQIVACHSWLEMIKQIF